MTSHHSSAFRSSLIALYSKLPAPEQKILRFFSVIYVPVTQSNMQQMLTVLDRKDPDSVRLKPLMDKLFRQDMLEQNLLVAPKSRLGCHPAIIELLTREAVNKKELDVMTAAANEVLPAQLPHRYSRDAHADIRALRIAIYQNNEKKIIDQLQAFVDHTHFHQVFGWETDVLIMIIANPLDEQWLTLLPESISAHVIAHLLNTSAAALTNNKTAFKILQQLDQNAPGTHWAWRLFEQHLLRGQIMDSEIGLPEPANMTERALLAWHQFIIGDVDLSISSYLQALKMGKKTTGKRNIYVPGLSGIFFILALIASRNPAQRVLAKKQTAMAVKVKTDKLLDVYLLLDQCLSVLLGKSVSEDYPMLSADWGITEPPMNLFQALVQVWLGNTPNNEQLSMLQGYNVQAMDSGYLWYSSAYAGLISRLDQIKQGTQANTEMAQAKLPYFNLVDLVPREAPWQRTLKALQGLNASAQGAANASSPANNLRMVWFLEGDVKHLTLAPREQKLGKTGRWSKGRPIAVKRLYEEPELFDYMTPADLKISDQIQRQKEYSYYSYHSKDIYFFGEKALLAAIKHPLIVWADQPATPVELLRGEPQLMVRKQKDKLLLELQPPIDDDIDLAIEAEGNNRLRLTEINEQHKTIAKLLGDGGLHVPLNARQQVIDSITSIAPLMTVHSEIGGGTAADTVEASSIPHILLQPMGEGLKLEIVVQPFAKGGPLLKPGLGGATVFAEIDGKQLQAERNLKQERKQTSVIYQHCPNLLAFEQDEIICEDPETALELLFTLQSLGEEQAILEWPQGKAVHLSREVHASQVNLSVRKEQDWFSVNGQITLPDGETLEMMRLLELLDQSKGRFLKLKDGQFLALTQELKQRLDQMKAFATQKGDKLQFHPLAAGMVDELSQEMQVKAGKHWKDQLKRISEAQVLNPELPSTLQAELRDYQLEGFRWLSQLAHWGAGACLADDMGLGKTIQSLALILSRTMHGPTLVIAPTSVCMNWQAEALKFAPTLNVRMFGSGDRQAMLDQAGPFDLLVCSYGLLQNQSEQFQKKQWNVIVVDEAQAIKNAHTKRSKAIMGLQGDFKLITTGTPIENHLGELWNLFQFINPGLLGSMDRFNQRFAIPIEQNNDPAARLHLKKLTQAFILRRLKRDVLTELPSRTEITLQVELSPEEKALIEALRRKALEQLAQSNSDESGGRKQLKILAEIMRLRRACCNPQLVMPDTDIQSSKLQAFAELVEELLENKHKALVFSQFVGHLAILRGWLDDKGIDYQYLDGSTPQKKRQQAVEAFQAGQGDLFLISLKAGGSGLNLTAADYVIHMDPWWNPAVEDQASDRAHRIGQQRPVTIYRLIAKDTIEEKIVALHKHKRDLADSLLEGSEMSAKMNVEEMMALIRDNQ